MIPRALGNGTEEIVKALVPRVEEAKIHSPFCSGVLQKVTADDRSLSVAFCTSSNRFYSEHVYFHSVLSFFMPIAGSML